MSQRAFKILTGEQWMAWQAQGIFDGSDDDRRDGFIHLSSQHQVQGTLDKHFADQAGLMIAEVDLEPLDDLVRWEVSRGGDTFPHVYGMLPIGVARDVFPAEAFAEVISKSSE